MSDEEKKAIERLIIYKDKIKDELYPIIDFEEEKAIGIVLNLIEKQQKEIEELKEDSCCMTNCVRRDKEKLFLEDKIREKIEELKEAYEDNYIINILQLLLEKE